MVVSRRLMSEMLDFAQKPECVSKQCQFPWIINDELSLAHVSV